MDADDLASVAEYYYLNRRRANGDRCVDFALSLHPSATNILTLKIRNLIYQHRFAEAEELLDKADDQDNRELLYVRVELMVVAGKKNAAEQMLLQHIPDADYDDEEEDEDNGKRSYMREVIGLWLDYGDVKYASDWVDRLRALPHLTTKDRIMLADYASAIGQANVARSILQEIVKAEPYNTTAWNMLARSGYENDEYQQAVDACETVLAIDENNYRATIQLVSALFIQTNYAGTIEAARKGRAKWPDDEICPLYEGMAHLQVYYDKDDDDDTDIEDLNDAYACLSEAEKKSYGESLEQSSIILYLIFVMAEYYFLATTKSEKAEYKRRTIEYVREMLRYSDDLSQVMFQLSDLLMQMGEKKMAEKILGNVLKN